MKYTKDTLLFYYKWVHQTRQPIYTQYTSFIYTYFPWDVLYRLILSTRKKPNKEKRNLSRIRTSYKQLPITKPTHRRLYDAPFRLVMVLWSTRRDITSRCFPVRCSSSRSWTQILGCRWVLLLELIATVVLWNPQKTTNLGTKFQEKVQRTHRKDLYKMRWRLWSEAVEP